MSNFCDAFLFCETYWTEWKIIPSNFIAALRIFNVIKIALHAARKCKLFDSTKFYRLLDFTFFPPFHGFTFFNLIFLNTQLNYYVDMYILSYLIINLSIVRFFSLFFALLTLSDCLFACSVGSLARMLAKFLTDTTRTDIVRAYHTINRELITSQRFCQTNYLIKVEEIANNTKQSRARASERYKLILRNGISNILLSFLLLFHFVFSIRTVCWNYRSYELCLCIIFSSHTTVY